MIGAIAGDVIGSVFEFNNIRTTDFPLFSHASRFTDDTVLTIAAADVLLGNGDYASRYKYFGRKYPLAGYGCKFNAWLLSDEAGPYNSYGNGSAMRVSPIGFAFDTLEEVLTAARESAEVTHNHPEGTKGAQATAAVIFLARKGADKNEIRIDIQQRFGYSLGRTLNEIRPAYFFDETCPGTVPVAITTFLESSSYENAIRLAISIGGDSDTIACICGGIAQAFYGGVPVEIISEIKKLLPQEFLDIICSFEKKFKIRHGLYDQLNAPVL
ncbi:MAG: ADP-ribosylglycohydrolase family protein [Anaerolineaceae bacterium]